MSSPIRTLNLNEYRTNSRSFVRAVKHSLTTTGFFLLENHGIPESLLLESTRLFGIFFNDLSQKERLAYARPEIFYQQGYTPPGMETGEYAQVADGKHFFQFGDPATRGMLAVEEIPELKGVCEDFYGAFCLLYKELMQVVALTLRLDLDYFDNQLGNSIVRQIHYPAQPNPTTDDEAVAVQGGNVVGMCASSTQISTT